MTIKTTIAEVLAASGMSASRSESRRMIAQRAVTVEGFLVTDPMHPISIISTLEIKISGSYHAQIKTVCVGDFLKVKTKEEVDDLKDKSLSFKNEPFEEVKRSRNCVVHRPATDDENQPCTIDCEKSDPSVDQIKNW